MPKRIFLIFSTAVVLFIVGIVARSVMAQEQGAKAISFHTYELWVDSKNAPLAAYQVEIIYSENVEITGLEGGEKEYEHAPYFDRKGLKGGRIIVAAYTTKHDLAPTGTTRVARIHTSVQGRGKPVLQVKFMAAAKAGGERMTVDVKLKKVN